MSRIRITWTFLFAAGLALLSHAVANAQSLPSSSSYDGNAINNFRNLDYPGRGGISKKDLPAAQEEFKKFAKYFADVISHPSVYKPTPEQKADPKIPTIDNGNNGILKEIDRFLLEAPPGGFRPLDVNSKGNLEPRDYIREMGAALDEALRKLIETHSEPVVRIQAARVLAHVARTGAPAHFKTITELLANPKTPTEVKYYLLQAAAGVLHAINPNELRERKHAADSKTVYALVKVLEDCINKPAMLVADFKPETATTEQWQVISVVRRQAIRALGQVKFVRLPGPDEKSPYLYPAYTLARIASSDTSVKPAPTPADCAEAVIGLCNMAPVEWQINETVQPIRNYNSDVAVEAVLRGLITFASPRADRNNTTLPWRSYSLRIAEALTKWRPLFDPSFKYPAPDASPAPVPAKVVPPSLDELIKITIPKVLAPMEKWDDKDKKPIADPEVNLLSELLRTRKADAKRKAVLFEGVKETTITFPE